MGLFSSNDHSCRYLFREFNFEKSNVKYILVRQNMDITKIPIHQFRMSTD